MSGKGGSGARRKQRRELESALTRPRSSPTPVFGTPSLPLLGLWASSTQTARILNRGGMEMCDADSSLRPKKETTSSFYFPLNRVGRMKDLDVNQ